MVARDLKSRKRSAIAGNRPDSSAASRQPYLCSSVAAPAAPTPGATRHLVGGIAAQGDKIWNLGGIDAIPRANLGGADMRHLASASGIKDGGMVRGELKRI